MEWKITLDFYFETVGKTERLSGELSESEEKQLRLRVKQLICGSLNGVRIRQSLLQPSQTGTQVPWKVQQLGARV